MASNTNSTPPPLRVVVFDNMRVRSHLFSRLFSEHPAFEQIYHPFLMPAFMGPEKLTVKLRHSEARRKQVEEDWAPIAVKDTYGSAVAQLGSDVERVEAAVCRPLLTPRPMRRRLTGSGLAARRANPSGSANTAASLSDKKSCSQCSAGMSTRSRISDPTGRTTRTTSSRPVVRSS